MFTTLYKGWLTKKQLQDVASHADSYSLSFWHRHMISSQDQHPPLLWTWLLGVCFRQKEASLKTGPAKCLWKRLSVAWFFNLVFQYFQLHRSKHSPDMSRQVRDATEQKSKISSRTVLKVIIYPGWMIWAESLSRHANWQQRYNQSYMKYIKTKQPMGGSIFQTVV